MYDAGEAEKGVIKPEFNRSVLIDFKGVKIISDAGVLMLMEVDERFDANHARLKMGVLAYNLLHMIRIFYLYGEEVRRSIEWPIRRLIKVGAKIAYHGRRWNGHITSVIPLAHHYRAVLGYG